MISEKKNGLERRVYFRPAWDKRSDDPKKDYGVHGMEIWFVIVGEKGAMHFGLSTGMMLKKTRDWWDKERRTGALSLFPMGIDVGYHSPVKRFESQEVVWPTKMIKKEGVEMDFSKPETMPEFEKIGDAPPVCEYIGVPCYSDGSALRAEQWEHIFLEKGDDEIWSMLEEAYRTEFV